MELFANKSLPLSKRMMPKDLDTFIGQSHLVGQGRPVRVMLENKTIHSMIFYGPPACGKTSLAEIIAARMGYRFVRTNALTLDMEGIREILREASEYATTGMKTIVFIDEIHRLIKPKQDAFLSSLENGETLLIGATTENPYFVLVPALRSRVFIYEFKNHTSSDLARMMDRALKEDEILSKLNVSFAPGAREFMLKITADPRRLLNTLEIAIMARPAAEEIILAKEDIESILNNADTSYSDKEGHFDTISAFIKSVRGSDIDAAVYYLAFMLVSGEDPLFIARRLVILAAEDIGLAYPEALQNAVACYQAVENIGMPEARIILSETTVLLAGVPKSNSAYLAVDKAMEEIRGGKIMPVPPYLREAGFSGAKDLGRGIGYKYPHDFPDHFVDQKYTDKPVHYYSPGKLGFEKKIADWTAHLRLPKENKEADNG